VKDFRNYICNRTEVYSPTGVKDLSRDIRAFRYPNKKRAADSRPSARVRAFFRSCTKMIVPISGSGGNKKNKRGEGKEKLDVNQRGGSMGRASNKYVRHRRSVSDGGVSRADQNFLAISRGNDSSGSKRGGANLHHDALRGGIFATKRRERNQNGKGVVVVIWGVVLFLDQKGGEGGLVLPGGKRKSRHHDDSALETDKMAGGSIKRKAT